MLHVSFHAVEGSALTRAGISFYRMRKNPHISFRPHKSGYIEVSTDQSTDLKGSALTRAGISVKSNFEFRAALFRPKKGGYVGTDVKTHYTR